LWLVALIVEVTHWFWLVGCLGVGVRLEWLDSQGFSAAGAAAPFDGGLFLLSREGLLGFLASQPTYDPVIQIEVFSLRDTEAQLVPQRGDEDPCKMERCRIAK
jgi:hypothetical protein